MSVPCGELVPIDGINRTIARLNKLLLFEDKPSWNDYRMVIALTVANACLGKFSLREVGSLVFCCPIKETFNISDFLKPHFSN